jgi:hypothetical protein
MEECAGGARVEVAPLDSVPVYYGTQMECLFLQTALEGSGIPAFIKNLSASVGPGEDVRLYVLRGDVERALPLIEDFKMHGRKSRP